MSVKLVGAVAFSLLSLSLLTTGREALHSNDYRVVKCPKGYAWAELHAVGQRFESGVVQNGDTPKVVVQHDLLLDETLAATTNGNYIPFLACGRDWNTYEREQANKGLSTKPVNYPFVLPR